VRHTPCYMLLGLLVTRHFCVMYYEPLLGWNQLHNTCCVQCIQFGITSCAESVSQPMKQQSGSVMPGIVMPLISCVSVGIRVQTSAMMLQAIYTHPRPKCVMLDYVVNCLEQKDACNTNTTSIYTTPASMANSLSKDHILYYLSEVWERSAAERLSDAFSLVLY